MYHLSLYSSPIPCTLPTSHTQTSHSLIQQQGQHHDQLLSILSGLCGMKPTPISSHHILLRPQTLASENIPNPTSKTKKRLDEDPEEKLIPGVILEVETDFTTTINLPVRENGLGLEKWIVRTKDVPEPETKSAVLRRVVEREFVSREELGRWCEEEAAGLQFISGYITKGHRFIHNNIIIHLTRVLIPAKGIAEGITILDILTNKHDTISSTNGEEGTKMAEKYNLLDPSGAFMLQATIRIDDSSKTALLQSATEELVRLKTQLKGVVELKVPDRQSLNTRVR